MCTVSWLNNEQGYQVFFNRDESRLRPVALPPDTFKGAHGRHIMPVDPEGGGTWISVNEHGVCVCLLNLYQAEYFPSKTTAGVGALSRGLLVKSLASLPSLSLLEQSFWRHQHNAFSPFSLLAFADDPVSSEFSVLTLRWDGRHVRKCIPEEAMLTSSVRYKEVMPIRQSVYRRIMSRYQSSENACLFHQSHLPERGFRSVCMHRDDAKTVSFTQVSVTKDKASMRYVNGSPCESVDESFCSLTRKP
ncbi:NRDE family protein [Veronia pacifica]|uniref:NRDE family protein n=1 Tax=Veronia pacifica TaxID=1080227 RepID=UPI0015863309|nr:NRDE family protein [Veronia pacifica]